MNKNIIGVLLIILIITISIISFIYENKEELNKLPEPAIIKAEDITSNDESSNFAKYQLEDRKSFEYKTINFPMYMFFKNINNKEFENIKIYPELKKFMSIEENYFKDKFNSENSYFYEIVDVEKIGLNYIYNVKYKTEGSNKVFIKNISSNGEYFFDDNYIKVDELNIKTITENIDITVESRAVFKNREIYKINMFNKSNENIILDDSLYGFYAIKDSNKYYHTLTKGSLESYRLYPNTNRVIYIEFKTNGPKEVFININGDNVSIYKI